MNVRAQRGDGSYESRTAVSARRGGGYFHHGLWLCSTLKLDLVCHHLQVRHVWGNVVLKPTRPIRPAVCKPRCSLYIRRGNISALRSTTRSRAYDQPPT